MDKLCPWQEERGSLRLAYPGHPFELPGCYSMEDNAGTLIDDGIEFFFPESYAHLHNTV